LLSRVLFQIQLEDDILDSREVAHLSQVPWEANPVRHCFEFVKGEMRKLGL
jgi:hypothetical protein